MKPAYATRDVSSKTNTLRFARAQARLTVSPSTIDALRNETTPKADPISVAKVAGMQAAKNTSLLIPHCHQVPLDHFSVDITLEATTIVVTAEVKAIWKTGVEMEALVAVSAAALTLYDMLKIIDDRMEIVSVKLLEKRGGKSSIRETGAGLTAAVLVLSDSVSKREKDDVSGKILVERLKKFGMQVPVYKVLPDVRESIVAELKRLADQEKIHLVITTGGTGVGPRDVTPEATLSVIDRRLEGVEESLRRFGQERLNTAMLSRLVAGLRGETLIVNLPGSPKGVEDGINAIFPQLFHTFSMLNGEAHREA